MLARRLTNAGRASAMALMMASGSAWPFDVEVIHPSVHSADTAAMDAALGITGLVIEDFEDVNLVPGLRVATTNPDSAPTSVLPNLYLDGSGVFNNNSWDGPGALVNTVNNWSWFCSDSRCALGNIAQRRTFLLPAASKVGIGLGNFQAEIVDHAVLVNGVEVVGAIESLPGFVNGVNVRNGYLTITAGPGEAINEVAIELRQNGTKATVAGASGDGLIFDRVAFAPLTGLASFKLKNSLVAGCRSVSGTVTLAKPAPVGGTVVALSDTLDAATTPLSLNFKQGAISRSFAVRSSPVAVPESGTVSVSLDGKTLSQPLTLRPMGLLSVTLKPTTVAGSQPVSGTAKLECAAGPGPVTVDLSSSKPSVAYPVATSVVIPQGVQSQPFTVATNAVLARTYAMITGEANGTTKTRKLNVTPAAEVSPRSLKFGNVAVGSTSGTLSTTLSNKGTSAFFVDSIGITGSYASWFSQSNSCPSSLPAGGSCTISVKFKPAFAAKKSAKLTIATSATSTPLSVSLSGTGL